MLARRIVVAACLAHAGLGVVLTTSPAVAGPLFAAPFLSFDIGGGPVVIGDLNGDGKPDLASPNSVLFGNGDGSFGARSDYNTRGTPVGIGVLDGDGNRDLDTANACCRRVSVSVGSGDGRSEGDKRYGTRRNPECVER